MDGNPTIDPELEQEGRALASGWSRADFEAAVPLFVGGDLDPLEAAAVRAYVEAHPERAAEVAAAEAARGVLTRGVVAPEELDGVDLWPGIRAALSAEGWLGAKRPTAREGAPWGAGAPLEPLTLVKGGRSADGATPRAPRRRLAASGLAAAAALVFTAGLAWVLGFDGVSPARGVLEPAPTGGAAVAAAGAPVSLQGSGTLNLVGRSELPQGVIRLGAPIGPPLEKHAIDVDLGSYHPDAAFPIGGHQGRPASLVGGVEAPRELPVLPPRTR